MAGRDEASQAERQARRAHARGLRLMERGWAPEATRALSQAVPLCPERVERWRPRVAAAGAEDLVEALTAAHEAGERDPAQPPLGAWLEDPLLVPLHAPPSVREGLERGPAP